MYTVELHCSDPAREEEGNAWYETYLAQLVALPGLSTAQRFRAVAPGTSTWPYLALYSVAALDVFESEAYRSIGGGGKASARFTEAIRRRRNVYAGSSVSRKSRPRAAYCCANTRGTDGSWRIVFSCPWRPRRGGARPAPPSLTEHHHDARSP